MPDPAAVLAIQVVANTAQANASLANTQRQLMGTQATATKATSKMKGGLLAVGVAAAAAGAALFKIGEEFDNAYDKISVRTGKTGKELDKLKGSFRSVVTTVPTDFESAAEAVAGLDQRLGASGKNLTTMSRQMTALSKITETDVEDNVRSVSRAFVDWEVKTKDQSRALDGLFRLSQVSGVAVADIADSVQKFGSPLRQLGFDLDTAAAMFANFERAGVNTQTMVPGLKLALANLNAPVGEAAEAMKKFNITIGDSPKGLREVFKVLGDDKVKAVDRITLAMSVFGRRAGADMKEAIEQGRFEVEKFLKVMKDGDETILAAERRTRDFSEQWQLFKNRVMVGLEPVATAVFKALGDGMKELNRLMQGRGGFAEGIKSIAAAFKDFWESSAIFRAVMKTIWDITKNVWGAITQIFRGQIKIVRGIVKVISGVLTGNFGRAWDGVKDIFRGAGEAVLGIFKGLTAPIRGIAGRIGDAMKGPLKTAAEAIKRVFDWMKGKVLGIFNDLKGAIGDALSWIEGAVNDALVELGIKERISIKAPAGPTGPVKPSDFGPAGPGGPTRRQMGGHIPGPSRGDTVPLLAEGGEFMVNSRAAKKHRPLLEAINRGIPRFQKGGGLDFALGPYDIPPIQYDSGHAAGNSHVHVTGTSTPWVVALGRKLQSMGMMVSEHPAFGGVAPPPTHSLTGGHYDALAIDINTAADETRAEVARIASLLGGGGFGGAAQKIGRIIFKGGPLAGIGQGAIDRVRKAANRFLAKQAPSGVAPTGGGAMSLGQIASLWTGVNRGLGDPNLMARIAMAESSGVPTAIGNDPGGTRGLGLWQITTGFNDDVIRKYGGESAMLTPVPNAKAAGDILRRQGLGAWAASGNWQQGGLIPWFGKGADFMASSPMVMGVGESGPERVQITPMGGGGQPEVYVEPPQVHVYVSGTGVDYDEIYHEIEEAISEATSHSTQMGRMR